MFNTDVIIVGASAAGLMCAIEAAKRGRQVTILDHANRAGKKILMSGGGRCNFTNLDIDSNNYISNNPHFCKSALSRYTQWHFIEYVQRNNIAYHEREHGQLFCDNSSKDILNMLLADAEKHNVTIQLNTIIEKISINDSTYRITTTKEKFTCESLVIASGGLSIPKMGATPFGYKIAEQFNINILATSAGLVPFTLQPEDKQRLESLSGIAINSIVKTGKIKFKENILFTHRGLSGPAILQISSYWKPGDQITINLLPDVSLSEIITSSIRSHPEQILKTLLTQILPKRLINIFFDAALLETKIKSLTKTQIESAVNTLHNWSIKPNGTEGYRTAIFRTHIIVKIIKIILFMLLISVAYRILRYHKNDSICFDNNMRVTPWKLGRNLTVV